MTDIISPRILKWKGSLFVFLGLLSGALLLLPAFSWKNLALLLLCIWAFCRAYYFCFYVMHHYVDPDFRYSGLMDLFKYFRYGNKTKPSPQDTSP